MLQQYAHVLLFVGLGTIFALGAFVLSFLLRERGHDPRTRVPYECGVEPVGTPRVRLNVRFYIFALLFVIFDVETLYIYPWAVVARPLGIAGFWEMVVFIAILFLALLYAWRKEAFRWE
ncbi:MAG: NADH-quinone oxidoreductase subunit A [Elusimicrobia bacterium]|nr:NADH-quinone oxidoreductase subunit A [Elusimicrobiota bacterium]